MHKQIDALVNSRDGADVNRIFILTDLLISRFGSRVAKMLIIHIFASF